MDERTYSKTEIREKRRAMEQRLALEQRQLEALIKMDEAADALEQAERELKALDSGSLQPERATTEAVQPDPDLRAIGERSAKILEDHAGNWLVPREILAEMDERGWIETDDINKAMQRLRHALKRLADNERIERDESGVTNRYRWRPSLDSYAPVAVSHANGPVHPALYGGRADG